MKYILNKTYSGQRTRERLMKIKFWSMFNWRLLCRGFIYTLAVIGVVLSVWIFLIIFLGLN